jgi:large subunit ribosomal protein L20
MPRAKNRVASRARRKKVLNATKGYFGKRKNCIRTAHDAFWRAGVYAYRDRRRRKRDFRSLWITRINAAARLNGMTYGSFISGLKKINCELNRKALAELAFSEPTAFAALVAKIQGQES